jgi:dienelactone hydrolase
VSIEERFRADRGEPLGLWRRPEPAPEAHPELRVESFEYSSRGDRVPGRLLLPDAADGPFPLVLLQHGNQGSKDAPYMLPVAAPWVGAGAAVMSIDFPLHGERASEKLSELLSGALGAGGEATPAGELLLREFVRQAVIDLQRALDAAEQMPEIDARRIAYAGLSLGSILGASFCGSDPRPRAAALALGGAGFGPPGIDPAHHVGRFAPRPILFVNASRDERVPRAAAEALHEAAGEPKETLWFDAGHEDLPGRALKAMWLFLERHLRG